MSIQEKLKSYLLGNLPAEEAERLDLQIIESSELDEEIVLAEHDLMENYLENDLSPEEKNLFQTNFLTSEERLNNLKHLALLKQYAQQDAEKSAAQTAEEKSFWQILEKFGQWISIPVASAAAILLVSIGLLWFIFWSDKVSVLQDEFVRLNQTDLSNFGELQKIPQLSLTEGTLRNQQEVKKFTVDKSSDRVLIRLALPLSFRSEDDFNVRITKTPGEILELKTARSFKNQVGTEIRFLVPSAFLTKGEYKIEVWQKKLADLPLSYPFLVE